MKKFLAWALIALPVLAACENEDELKDENVSGTSVEVSMKAMAGEWYVNEPDRGRPGIETLVIQENGSFVLEIENSYMDPSLQTLIVNNLKHVEGQFELEGNILRGTVSKAQSKYAVWEQGRYVGLSDWEEDTHELPDYAEVVLVRSGSVMLLRSEFGTVMYFKKGAQLPNDISEIQGIWFSFEAYKAGDEKVCIAMKMNGDNIDLIVEPWAQRFICKYTYKDGIIASSGEVTFRTLWREDGCDDFDYDDPWAASWHPTYDPQQYTGNLTDGFTFPFVVDGNKAYCLFVGNSPLFIKQ